MSIKKVNIEQLRKQMNKKFGDEKVQLGKELSKTIPIHCSTGSYTLDLVLGCRGIPKGRILGLQGPESGGKTLMSLIMAAEIQKNDGNVGFIDVEGTYVQGWAENFGVTEDNLLYMKPSSGGEALEMVVTLVQSNIDLIIVDSVAALISEREKEKEIGQDSMAELARLMSTGLKKIQNVLQTSTSTIIFISQLRNAVGSYGNPEKATGGKALQYYASLFLDVRKREVIGDKENPEGFTTAIKAVKNKIGHPNRKIEIDLYIGPSHYGIDKEAEIFNVACQLGIIQKQSKDKETGEYIQDEKGSYYSYKSERFYGLPKMMKYIESNPSEMELIKKEVERIMDEKYRPAEGSFNAKIIKSEEGDDYVEETEE
jgi:recombination protein RecA